jgi:hypothetical protein
MTRVLLAPSCAILILIASTCSNKEGGVEPPGAKAETGTLEVITVTTGDDVDPDGYSVTVDGVLDRAIAANDTVTIDELAEGEHSVELFGIDASCIADGENPRTVNVPAGEVGETTFDVGCTTETGMLEVTTVTTGDDIDPDGYTVTVDGSLSQAIGANDTVTFTDLAALQHTVELTDVAGNCVAGGENPRTVSVPAGGVGETTFEIGCTQTTGTTIVGVSWDCDGLIVDADGSDLWPMTWSDDDRQYTSWGDGNGFDGSDRVGYGLARLEGEPTSYAATERSGFETGKIAGMISIGGTLYMWRNEQDGSPPTHTLIKSIDKGQAVAATPVEFPRSGASEMVPTTLLNFGRDNADAIDGYVYSYGADWETERDTYLIRAPADAIESPSAYEVFSGTPESPAWSADMGDRRPVYTDPSAATANGAGHTVVTYFPPLGRFILTAHHRDDVGQWSIHEGPTPWGPWTEVDRYSDWCGFGGSQTEMLPIYIAPKWISSDGREFWIAFSATGMWDRFNLMRGAFELR